MVFDRQFSVLPGLVLGVLSVVIVILLQHHCFMHSGFVQAYCWEPGPNLSTLHVEKPCRVIWSHSLHGNTPKGGVQ